MPVCCNQRANVVKSSGWCCSGWCCCEHQQPSLHAVHMFGIWCQSVTSLAEAIAPASALVCIMSEQTPRYSVQRLAWQSLFASHWQPAGWYNLHLHRVQLSSIERQHNVPVTFHATYFLFCPFVSLVSTPHIAGVSQVYFDQCCEQHTERGVRVLTKHCCYCWTDTSRRCHIGGELA